MDTGQGSGEEDYMGVGRGTWVVERGQGSWQRSGYSRAHTGGCSFLGRPPNCYPSLLCTFVQVWPVDSFDSHTVLHWFSEGCLAHTGESHV